MHGALDVAVTSLPLLVVAVLAVLGGGAVVRSLRDESVVEALRAEIRTVGEVQRAVHEARTGPPTHL